MAFGTGLGAFYERISGQKPVVPALQVKPGVADKSGSGTWRSRPSFPPARRSVKSTSEGKERVGLEGVQRGRTAAGIDAAGATIGTIGLMISGLIVCRRIDIVVPLPSGPASISTLPPT